MVQSGCLKVFDRVSGLGAAHLKACSGCRGKMIQVPLIPRGIPAAHSDAPWGNAGIKDVPAPAGETGPMAHTSIVLS